MKILYYIDDLPVTQSKFNKIIESIQIDCFLRFRIVESKSLNDINIIIDCIGKGSNIPADIGILIRITK